MKPFCKTSKCPFNSWDNDDDKCIIKRFKYSVLYVPQDSGNFGHMLLITKRHVKDITELGPDTDKETKTLAENLLIEMNKACYHMKRILKKGGMGVARVYVATLNESGGENSHLHFHLIPRYEGDRTGFEFLYRIELDEAKWKLAYQDKSYTPYERLRIMQGKIEGELSLLDKNQWLLFKSKKEQAKKRLELATQIRKLFKTL